LQLLFPKFRISEDNLLGFHLTGNHFFCQEEFHYFCLKTKTPSRGSGFFAAIEQKIFFTLKIIEKSWGFIDLSHKDALMN